MPRLRGGRAATVGFNIFDYRGLLQPDREPCLTGRRASQDAMACGLYAEPNAGCGAG